MTTIFILNLKFKFIIIKISIIIIINNDQCDINNHNDGHPCDHHYDY